MADTNKLCKSLLEYRNTPSRKDGRSPAKKLYGHPIQDTLPAHGKSFAPEWQRSTTDAMDQANSTLETAKQYYNSASHPLPEIRVGINVAVQDPHTKLWDTYGIVTALGPHRQYHIKTQRGSALVRNRRFICCRVPDSVPYLRTPELPKPVAEQAPITPVTERKKVHSTPYRGSSLGVNF